MGFELDNLVAIQSTESISWEPRIYDLLQPFAPECTLLQHGTAHGTADDCMKILEEHDYPNNGLIIPVVSQVGLMRIPDSKGVLEKRRVLISHYGAYFVDHARKVVADAFGTSRKHGKEYSRIQVENGEMRDLIGVPEGVSSPLIPASFYDNFYRVAMVLDSTIHPEPEVLAIAASRNSTLLMPKSAFETVMTQFSEQEPRLIVVRFNGLVDP